MLNSILLPVLIEMPPPARLSQVGKYGFSAGECDKKLALGKKAPSSLPGYEVAKSKNDGSQARTKFFGEMGWK
jgi:hypothetical protein